jgi:hypothetical protein
MKHTLSHFSLTNEQKESFTVYFIKLLRTKRSAFGRFLPPSNKQFLSSVIASAFLDLWYIYPQFWSSMACWFLPKCTSLQIWKHLNQRKFVEIMGRPGRCNEKLSNAKLGSFQLNFSIQEFNQAKNKPRFGQIWKKKCYTNVGFKKLCLPWKGAVKIKTYYFHIQFNLLYSKKLQNCVHTTSWGPSPFSWQKLLTYKLVLPSSSFSLFFHSIWQIDDTKFTSAAYSAYIYITELSPVFLLSEVYFNKICMRLLLNWWLATWLPH